MCPTTPSTKTLNKYGLDEDSWGWIAHRQGFVCGVCGKLPSSGRLNIDHDHVKGYKKLSPERKRKHIRGLLCYVCNKFFAMRGMTEEKARRLVKYLASYAERSANG